MTKEQRLRPVREAAAAREGELEKPKPDRKLKAKKKVRNASR
jgi:hypothetical protein